jgi:preprotein translocase subunit SecG
METVLLVIHVASSFLLVIAILLQSGKGGGLASGFGGASAGTQMFGGAGAGGFMSKATIFLAATFMSTSLALAYISSQPQSTMSLEGGGAVQNQEEEIIEPGSGAAEEVREEAAEPAQEGGAAPIQVQPGQGQPTNEAPATAPEGAAPPAPAGGENTGAPTEEPTE